MADPDYKRRIAQSFDRAANRYEEAAELQRDVANRLAARLSEIALPQRPQVLEIGCGTGFLTSVLRELAPRALIVAADLSLPMVARARQLAGTQATRWVCMDGERPALQQAPRYDLICTSLAAQWFVDLESALARLARTLMPGGTLAYATLAQGTFRQWREAHGRLGLTARTHGYPSVEQLQRMWPTGGSGSVDSEELLTRHATPLAFLTQLRRLGAQTPAPGSQPVGPAALRRVIRSMQRPEGIEISYQIAYGLFKKDGWQKHG